VVRLSTGRAPHRRSAQSRAGGSRQRFAVSCAWFHGVATLACKPD
jgi:hypothetical protein